jgi:hypothetical protein
LVELPLFCGGVPELLTPKEVTLVEDEGRFIATGEFLSLVVSSYLRLAETYQLPEAVCQNC